MLNLLLILNPLTKTQKDHLKNVNIFFACDFETVRTYIIEEICMHVSYKCKKYKLAEKKIFKSKDSLDNED